MKTKVENLKLLSLTLAMSFMTICGPMLNAATAGNTDGGGGFGPARLSKYLIRTKVNLVEQLEKVPAAKFASLKKPVDKTELLRIISTMRLEPTKDVGAISPYSGLKEFKLMNYDIDSTTGLKYIEALRPFFEIYSQQYRDSHNPDAWTYFVNAAPKTKYFERIMAHDPMVVEIQRQLLHEALHHFGYAELEARAFSEKVIERYTQQNKWAEECRSQNKSCDKLGSYNTHTVIANHFGYGLTNIQE